MTLEINAAGGQVKGIKTSSGDGSPGSPFVTAKSIDQTVDGETNKVRATQPTAEDLQCAANLKVAGQPVDFTHPVPVWNKVTNPPHVIVEDYSVQGESAYTPDTLVYMGKVIVEISGTWVGEISIQTRRGLAGTWKTWARYTGNIAVVVELPAGGRYMKVGFEGNKYTSGAAVVTIEQGEDL